MDAHHWKSLIPLGLSPLYETPTQVFSFDPPFLVSAFIVMVITVGLILLIRRWPAGLAIWVYYVVTLAPVSGITHAGLQLTADRYSYLPCLGWALLFGAGVYAVGAARPSGKVGPALAHWGVVVAAAWCIGLGVLCWQQVQIWHDPITLWTYNLSRNPKSSLAHNNLGNVLIREGKLAEPPDSSGRPFD